jgi:hypothetical protein
LGDWRRAVQPILPQRKRAGAVSGAVSETPNFGSGGADDPFLIPSSPIREDEYEDVITLIFLAIVSNLSFIPTGHCLRLHQETNHRTPRRHQYFTRSTCQSGGGQIWLKSMKDQNIGQDVAHMMKDVRHFTQTEQTRPTTWAKPGNKASAR